MDLELLRRTEYNQQYIAAMRPVFNRRALFTDTSAEYEIKAGKILIEMPQTSATILKYVQE